MLYVVHETYVFALNKESMFYALRKVCKFDQEGNHY